MTRCAPFTLHFPPEDERQYREEQLAISTRVTKVAAPLILTIAVILQFVVQPLVFDRPFANPWVLFTHLGYTCALAAGVLSCHLPRRVLLKHGDTIVAATAILNIIMVIMVFRQLPPERVASTFGFLHAVVMVNSFAPYAWRHKAVVNLTVPLAFWFAYPALTYTPTAQIQILVHLATTCSVGIVVGWVLERFARQQWLLNRALRQERSKSQALIENILPTAVAERLGQDGQVVVDRFEATTVLFADIVGFTNFAARRQPDELVAILNQLFSRFDAIVGLHRMEKIKTIGDAYMAVAGLPDGGGDHARIAAEVALDFRAAVERFRIMTGHDLQIRIGMHSGPAVAGIIGRRKFHYDLWGDTVNIASRMESSGLAGEIQISQATRDLLGESYLCLPRGEVPAKGAGNLRTYLLRPRQPGAAYGEAVQALVPAA